MSSFLAAVHRAARYDTASTPPETGSHVHAAAPGPSLAKPTPETKASNLQADAIRAAAQAEVYNIPAGSPDQPNAAGGGCGWSKIIAAQPDAAGAVASGGPAEPHPSSFAE